MFISARGACVHIASHTFIMTETFRLYSRIISYSFKKIMGVIYTFMNIGVVTYILSYLEHRNRVPFKVKPSITKVCGPTLYYEGDVKFPEKGHYVTPPNICPGNFLYTYVADVDHCICNRAKVGVLWQQREATVKYFKCALAQTRGSCEVNGGY